MEGKPFQTNLFGQVTSPSLLGEMSFVVDTKRLDVEDVVAVLEGIAAGTMDHHVLLMVEEGSKVLERRAWRVAVEKIGLIEERSVTIDDYRAVTRYLLQSSDLKEVDQFGNDDKFLRQMKKCVQGNRRISLFTASMEIDRIILTQVENGVVLDSDQDSAAEVREQRDLRLRLNQFLDERTTATLHPLLALADAALLAGNEPHHMLARLFNASASIIAGRDQRYKRNREGNPAVLPYLVWGMLLLARGHQLLSANLVVSFEQLCQNHHVAATDPIRWLAYERNWQQVAICLLPVESDEPAASETGLLVMKVLGAAFLLWLS